MAAVSVSAQNTRLDDAESTTDWGSIGTGPAAALETDFVYQNTNCVAKKGDTNRKGVMLNDNTTSDISGAGTYNTVMFKVIVTTPGLLLSQASRGMNLYIGSNGDISNHFYRYDVHGNDTYPLTASWLIIPIDPNVSGYRDATTGTPNMAAADTFGLDTDQSGASKSPNVGMDAVDIGAGMTLTGGDGASTDGVFDDFVSHDEGTANNRYGYVSTQSGIIFVFGKLIIGSATATVFQDSFQTIVFPDGLFAQGFSGISIGLQSATNDIDFTSINFLGKGNSTTEETRPTFDATGTSGAFDALNCLFENFDTIDPTSTCTFTTCTFVNFNQITQLGATFAGCTFNDPDTASGVAAIVADDAVEISDCSFVKGANGHAIEIRPTGAGPFTINLSGNQFSGYAGSDGSTGEETILIHPVTNSADITINIVGGGSTPSIMEHADYTGTFTLVVSPVTMLVQVDDDQGANLSGARVLVKAATGGPLPFEESVSITRSGSTATVSHTAHGLATNDKVLIAGANEDEYNGVRQITVTGVNAYTYTVSGSPATPATGTITSTFVVLEGTTDGSGEIESTKAYPSNQPITGVVRKATASPFWKAFHFSGTIQSASGLTVTVQLIKDE